MLPSLQIKNFRAFRALTIERLGRVNLIVGTNNAGKTCVLEAVELLFNSGDPRFLWRAAVRRDEVVAAEIDVANLFHGHALTPGEKVELQCGPRNLRIEVIAHDELDFEGDRLASSRVALSPTCARARPRFGRGARFVGWFRRIFFDDTEDAQGT
jgi:hypothetical protein